MVNSPKPIRDHAPEFLQYCVEIGLSLKTKGSYEKFLNKFLYWLGQEKIGNLLPHELTENHIVQYRSFLEGMQNGKSLSDATQNYYLIALRSLLKYFKEKGISSLSLEKVTLRKYHKKEVNEEFLNSEQIKKLLLAPDINTDKGLRDRVILEYILSTGLRINELVSLNVDFAHDLLIKENQSFFSENVFLWINKYLKIRKKYCSNSDKAFLVHLNSKTCGENRLTAESIERLIIKYGREVSVNLKITSEVLRKSYFEMFFSKEIEINEIHCHRQLEAVSAESKRNG
jgi:integrase/recombinase XerD